MKIAQNLYRSLRFRSW